jgi:uncharacterized protein (DUF849 family)
VGLACLVPGLRGRARVVLASYAVGWPLDRPGLQVFVVVPDEDAEPWKRVVVPLATSAASWSAVMLLAVSAVRRSALPAPVAGVLLGGAVIVGDSLLKEVGERAKASAQRAREAAEAAAPAGAPAGAPDGETVG